MAVVLNGVQDIKELETKFFTLCQNYFKSDNGLNAQQLTIVKSAFTSFLTSIFTKSRLNAVVEKKSQADGPMEELDTALQTSVAELRGKAREVQAKLESLRASVSAQASENGEDQEDNVVASSMAIPVKSDEVKALHQLRTEINKQVEVLKTKIPEHTKAAADMIAYLQSKGDKPSEVESIISSAPVATAGAGPIRDHANKVAENLRFKPY
mmetsp:Transcript_16869/g.32930  ORF Transcript_16869/g.32930 Transcript_16869/m.32930 type:complete len:211 (+) Transcript_16869:83-715(+)|eukprot:CAMPEP_0175131240 /NCGR_PEP_ID=MMETSP0087-20121206/6434_1 /TAXON_ID=136419 /ORGANISM="Unknown Unknown, Strain D1" /LENGTH=210 /DNA_ID=CAMNT_0016413511 /DNA_START=69 /DNA_END=701 /DNA_ORIENTATION=+